MRTLFVFITVIACNITYAQGIHQKLDVAVKHMLADTQMHHAVLGLYVVNSKTGKPVYSLNSTMGLAPASTQKIFTGIAAFDILGGSYTYKTTVGYKGTVAEGVLNGDLIIKGYGDPSFGSWRYEHTKMDSILQQITATLHKAGIGTIKGNIVLDETALTYQPIPGGWIWEDIGNYYGAGVWGINWNENQYDLTLRAGDRPGEKTEITSAEPSPELFAMNNMIKTGAAGSGDNSIIYVAPYAADGFAEGTIPAGEKHFTVSGSLPYPSATFGKELTEQLKNDTISFTGNVIWGAQLSLEKTMPPTITTTLLNYTSPPLDSLMYWFLQKSINMYGEAFAKTIALEKGGQGETGKGVDLIRDYWQRNGIEKTSVKMLDGSGLSPQNRVTPEAEVLALQHAKTRPWFKSFYNCLPLYNGIKMKSGTIGGSKAFTGYHTAADGTEYTFSIIVNNYDGTASAIVQKMYTVLNVLK